MSYPPIFGIAPKPITRQERPVDDPRYRAWIRTFPCVVCGSARRIEAAHTGPRGLGQKSDSKKCLPFCFGCHQDKPDSYHKIGPVAFAAKHQLDIPNLIAQFNELWAIREARRAA